MEALRQRMGERDRRRAEIDDDLARTGVGQKIIVADILDLHAARQCHEDDVGRLRHQTDAFAGLDTMGCEPLQRRGLAVVANHFEPAFLCQMLTHRLAHCAKSDETKGLYAHDFNSADVCRHCR